MELATIAQRAVEAAQAAGATDAEAVKALERQCRALWGEAQKTPKAKG